MFVALGVMKEVGNEEESFLTSPDISVVLFLPNCSLLLPISDLVPVGLDPAFVITANPGLI
jgi:hypothetical protein